MIIPLKDFSGLRLNADPTDIPDNAAQHCTDVDFSRSILQGLPGNVEATAAQPSPIRGALIYSDTDGIERAFAWPYAVHAVQSPVQQDDHKRFYWTGHNGTSNEFRFGRMADNPGNDIVSSYKVGVINNTVWDNNPGSIGVEFDTAPVGPPVAMGDLTSSDASLWLCDTDGALIRDVTYTVTSFVGVGAPVNGWNRTYRLTVNTTLAEHAEKQVVDGATTVVYGKTSASLMINSSTVVMGEIWYDGDVAKYIVLASPSSWLGGIIGQQVRVQTVRQDDQGYMYTELGLFYVKSATGLSKNNTSVPTALSVPAAGDTVLPDGYRFALQWKVGHAGQVNEVVFHEDKSMSGALDIGSGITGALTKIDDTTYDINLTFGTHLGYETRAYVITVVNRLSEESEPSTPIEITMRPGMENVRVKVNTSVMLNGMNASSMATDRYPLHGFRVYRSIGGEYFYVGTLKGAAEAALAGESYLDYSTDGSTLIFVDDVSGAALGDACSTLEYISDAEELQKLQGLCRVYNGIMTAFKDNEVWLSEPYMPWAWKRSNVVSLPYRVVAIAPHEQGLLVMTELKTYYMGGQQPSDFVPSALSGDYPCMGIRAVASVNRDIVYLSTDGPVIVSGASQRLDQTIAGRDAWRDMVADVSSGGADIRLVQFGSRLLMYWGSAWSGIGGQPSWGILLNVETGQWTHITTPMTFAAHLPANSFSFGGDVLAFSHNDNKFWLFSQNGDVRQSWVWHSKDFTAPWPTNFGAMQMYGAGTVRVQVYADGVLKHTQDVAITEQGGIIRLPSGFRGVIWSFKFSGLTPGAKLRRVYVATSPSELKNVV